MNIRPDIIRRSFRCYLVMLLLAFPLLTLIHDLYAMMRRLCVSLIVVD